MTVAESYRRNFLALLLLLITVAFVILVKRFLMPVLLAAIFAALITPMYRWMLRLFRNHEGGASFMTILIVFLLVVIPLILFAGILVSEAIQVSTVAGPWIQKQLNDPEFFTRKLDRLPFSDKIIPYQHEILQRLAEAVKAIGTAIVGLLSGATRGTVTFFFNVVIFLYAMFFFLKDGRRYLEGIVGSIPLSQAERARIGDRFVSVTRAALVSTVVIGVIQGTLGGVAFAVMHVPGAVFWGTIMAVLSMIPGLGTALVWLPVCIWLFATGRVGTAIGLAVYFAAVVGSVDNLLRPRLVGKETQMPDLLVLLSTLGGLMLFGAVGFILGPILAALFVTIWSIFTAFVQESKDAA